MHDGLNRVRQVSFGAEMVTAHAYDLLGRRTGTNRGPGANSAYAYDIASQLTGASHAWNGGNLNSAYGYDPAGQLTSEVPDNLAFLWQPAATLARTTTYDKASPINALTAVDGVAQPYDARGNRLAASGKTYRYDTRNMLVGASAPGQTVSYGYYPEGGRAWKQVNGVTTLYLDIDGVEWGSYDAGGVLKERTIRASGAGGAVIATHSNAGLIRLLPNRQGSIIGWLRPDGRLGGAYTYDAYGNSPQAGTAGPQYRYAGMRLDAETGLYHTPFRAYDPVDGRWMQLDPAGLVDGLNRYAYVKNSPLMGVDPTGLSCTSTNGTYDCIVDKIIDKKTGEKRDLTSSERSAVKPFEKSYTAAVNKMASNPDRKHTIKMKDENGRPRSHEVNGGEVAKAAIGRQVIADPNNIRAKTSGTPYGATTRGNTTNVGSLGLSGLGLPMGRLTGTPEQQADQVRQMVVAHEAMHGVGTDTDEYMAPGGHSEMGRPYYNDAHQVPHNEAARALLSF